MNVLSPLCHFKRKSESSRWINGYRECSRHTGQRLTCCVQQLVHCTAYPHRLLNVPACGVRESSVEEFRFHFGVVDELQNPSIFHALISLPDAAKDLIEPGSHFFDQVSDVGLKVAIEHDGEQNTGVVVKQEDAKIVHRADAVFPVGGFGLELLQALAEDLRSSRRNPADAGELASLPDPSAGTVRLTGHLLGQCGTFVVDPLRHHRSPLSPQL